MFQDQTLMAWIFGGVLLCGALVLFYSHMEGNLLSATRSYYEDIRRDMRRKPSYRVWWIALRMAVVTRRY